MITETLAVGTGIAMIEENNVKEELISVIMPAYNLEHVISLSILRVKEILDRYYYNYEIIVVDDGSKDNTYEQARKVSQVDPERIKVYRLPRNKGKGYALIYGYKRSHGDIIVFFDADLDIDPHQIPFLIETLKRNGADAVVTSKWHPRSKTIATTHRRLLSKAFYALVRLFLGIKISDTQTGAKAFRRETIKAIIEHLTVKRYAFDVELLTAIVSKGYSIVEVPALWRITLTSKFRFTEIFRMLIDLIAITYRYWVKKQYVKNK